MLRADLHLHTGYSPDSTTLPEDIIARSLEVGINCLAVTDHNTIAGALKLKEIAPFTIIVGEEIRSVSGEIIGLFLTKEVPPGLSAAETVRQIKSQKGLVCLPHPFDPPPRSGLDRHARELILPEVDIIEVFNSRTTLKRHCDRARLLAQTNGLLASAGSDAHTLAEIGNAYVELPEFSGAEEFKLALRQGRFFGRRAGPGVHLMTTWAKLTRRLKRARQ